MIISSSKSFIFVHLEKCGGTSVENALEPYLSWYDMILGSTDFGERLQNLYAERFGVDYVRKDMLWKHSTAKDIHAFVGPDQWHMFKKFSIVRSPEDLIVSLYNFSAMLAKYHMGRINRTVWIEKLRTNDFPNLFPLTEQYFIEYIKSAVDDSGINGFVENILSNDYDCVDSQFNRISINGVPDIGKVVDLSELQNEWDNVTDYLGFEDKIVLPKLNVSEQSGEELSARAIKKIKKRFAIDYQLLPKYTGISW